MPSVCDLSFRWIMSGSSLNCSVSYTTFSSPGFYVKRGVGVNENNWGNSKLNLIYWLVDFDVIYWRKVSNLIYIGTYLCSDIWKTENLVFDKINEINWGKSKLNLIYWMVDFDVIYWRKVMI